MLAPEQLQSRVPGTYGSILETMPHLVGSDPWYLFYLTGDRAHRIDEDQMDLIDVWEYGRQVGRVVEIPPRPLDEEPMKRNRSIPSDVVIPVLIHPGRPLCPRQSARGPDPDGADRFRVRGAAVHGRRPGGHRWTFSETLEDVDPATWGGTLLE